MPSTSQKRGVRDDASRSRVRTARPTPSRAPSRLPHRTSRTQRSGRRSRPLRWGGAVLTLTLAVAGARAWKGENEDESARKGDAALTAGSCRLDTQSDLGRKHVENPSYSVEPPSGGDHAPNSTLPGDYTNGEVVPSDGELVHSLEHGYVILWVNPDVAGADRDRLRVIASEFTFDVLLVPRPALGLPVVATAWHNRLLCGQVEPAVLSRFISEFRNAGPERVPHTRFH